jgi:hypothetical protein
MTARRGTARGTDTGTAEYAQITFGHAQTFDTIVVQSPYPQHRNSTLLDFDVQWLDADGTSPGTPSPPSPERRSS